jgi:uncharacterized protein Veg
MRFRYHEVSTLPPLAWCARVDANSGIVAVSHGSWVETRPGSFVEGAWNGSFESQDFTSATILSGTGGILEQDRVRFSASTDALGPLFTIAKDKTLYVSNSPAFAMAAAQEEPDDIYPFYTHDLLRIFRRGLHGPNGYLRLRSRVTLGVHFSTVITVGEQGAMAFGRHRLCEAPTDFQSYKELLLDGVGKVLENAADATRRRTYRPVAALSKGYDSTAAAVLASSKGCTESFTYTDARRKDRGSDSGAENARRLGMECKEYDRWQYLELDGCAEAEFGYDPTSSHVPLAAAAGQLAGCIMVNGEFGDTVWTPSRIELATQLSRPWNRFTIGLGLVEFRLRAGYQVLAPASIGARHTRAIHNIGISEEMRPWSVGGDYDRPIPRRIAEEAGLPRDSFGTRKLASGHSHLNDPSRFSEKALNDYRDFVRQRHAQIPWLVRNYWRTRERWRRQLLQIAGRKQRRFVSSSPWQRQFPFILNVTPIPVAWDFMFTFQWTAASMRSRYSLPAAARD